MGDKFPHVVECYDIGILSSSNRDVRVDPLAKIVVNNEDESLKADRDLAKAHPNCWIVHVPCD